MQHGELVIGKFGEALRGMARHLAGGIGITELIGIRPDHGGQFGAGLVTGGQVERKRERHAIGPFVIHELFCDTGGLGCGVGEVSEGFQYGAGSDEVIGRLGGAFAAD